MIERIGTLKSMMKKQLPCMISMFGVSMACTGCGRAPSIDIIGSFFPVWMVCLTLAIFLVFAVRYILLRYRLEQEVGPLALFYPSAVVFLTSLLWLIFFR
jgi:hypothetical protein